MEKDLWNTFKEALGGWGHFERIENMTGRGRPDVNYCILGQQGDIELKQIREWPKREDTVVEVDHYSPAQRLWCKKRLAHGGTVWLLLGVQHPRQYFLFPGAWAMAHLGKDARKGDLLHHAQVMEMTRFPKEDIYEALAKRPWPI